MKGGNAYIFLERPTVIFLKKLGGRGAGVKTQQIDLSENSQILYKNVSVVILYKKSHWETNQFCIYVYKQENPPIALTFIPGVK